MAEGAEPPLFNPMFRRVTLGLLPVSFMTMIMIPSLFTSSAISRLAEDEEHILRPTFPYMVLLDFPPL